MRVLCYRKSTCASNSDLAVFYRRSILFVLSVIFIVLLIFAQARYLSHENLEIDDGVSVIVCGDSHTKSAINDSILSSSINMSFASQPYFFTYSVLRPLLRNNRHIETVILGYSFHSLSPIMDTILFDSEKARENSLNRDAFLVVTELSYICKLIYNDNIEIFVSLARNSLRQIWKQIHSSDIHDMLFIGEYYSSIRQNLSTENIEAAVQRHYYSQNESNGSVPLFQLHYLYEIASLCEEYNVTLYLVNTPISIEYYEKIPESYLSKYYYVASTVNAVLLDYHNYQLPDSCFGDADHLNCYGAEGFSLLLDSLLN